MAEAETITIDPFDVALGLKVHTLRTLRRMTQAQLATASGVTFQQIQKYEKGTNRINCSRLQQIATALKVKPSYFFEDHEADSDLGSALATELARAVAALDAEQVTLLTSLAVALAKRTAA